MSGPMTRRPSPRSARWGRGRRRLRRRIALRGGPEAGNAPVEFIGWTVVLVVPVVYLLIALAQVQAASFAVASAADAASRILEVEQGEAAVAHARVAVGLALADQGVDADPATALSISCADASCSAAVVRVQAGVDLPLLGTAGLGQGIAVMDAARSVSLAGGAP
ncbi:peptidase T4 [Actinomyces procaprae]|uniref:peptidase T4 n=1 Tax=Actinomyces procaprae TaxID=2560010 RepID=UPI001FFBB117|nr:peptidase T4 [Actinomyces procaprae]